MELSMATIVAVMIALVSSCLVMILSFFREKELRRIIILKNREIIKLSRIK